jgi:hypothetical protein
MRAYGYGGDEGSFVHLRMTFGRRYFDACDGVFVDTFFFVLAV